MDIRLASSDEEVLACYPVISVLRPNIPHTQFLPLVRRAEAGGYRLVCLYVDKEPVAVAGVRISENFAWGRFLYVDDLVTLDEHRSKGYGSALLDWLRFYAKDVGCEQMHLDSGLHRADAHRFYQREGVNKTGYHFAEALALDAQ